MEQQKCKICNEVKNLDEFEFVAGKYYIHTCKICRRNYFNDLYKERKDYCKSWCQLRRRENVEKMFNYLSLNPCVDCGEADPILLEFDHVRGKKESSVSRLVHTHKRWDQIEVEIKKCEIRCVKCHRIKTATQQGWYLYCKKNLTVPNGVMVAFCG